MDGTTIPLDTTTRTVLARLADRCSILPYRRNTAWSSCVVPDETRSIGLPSCGSCSSRPC